MALTVELEKKLGDFRLEVSFTAGEGETLALLGASGSGKSVTLRCIAGVERPDRGRVVLDGMTLFDSAAHINLPPQKRRVGYLFQNYALFPHMTAEENIAVCLRRLPKALRQARVMELLNLLGSSPADSSSGRPWHGFWRRTRGRFCWTNLLPPWTSPFAGRWSNPYGRCWRALAGRWSG